MFFSLICASSHTQPVKLPDGVYEDNCVVLQKKGNFLLPHIFDIISNTLSFIRTMFIRRFRFRFPKNQEHAKNIPKAQISRKIGTIRLNLAD